MRGFSSICLTGTKTEANVGGAMRAASAFGCSLVVLERMRFKRLPTDTQKSWRSIPVLMVQDWREVIPFDTVPVVIEIVDGAVSLPLFQHPQRAFYIFGPEDGSVRGEILDRVSCRVSIPTQHCLNLAATVNVVLYDRIAKGAANGM